MIFITPPLIDIRLFVVASYRLSLFCQDADICRLRHAAGYAYVYAIMLHYCHVIPLMLLPHSAVADMPMLRHAMFMLLFMLLDAAALTVDSAASMRCAIQGVDMLLITLSFRLPSRELL